MPLKVSFCCSKNCWDVSIVANSVFCVPAQRKVKVTYVYGISPNHGTECTY